MSTGIRFRKDPPARRSHLIIGLLLVLGLVVVGVGAYVVKKVIPVPTLGEVVQAAASIEETTIGGESSIILTPHSPTQGIVVYAHGNNQTEQEVLTGGNVAPLTADLLDAGYIVAASLAEGNAWGNDASIAAYEALIEHAQEASPVDDVYLLGESMGGLPSLRLAASIPDVKAWVGFYPVCDVSTILDQEDLREGVNTAYPNGGEDTVSPPPMPDVPLLFLASPDDTRVPKESNSDRCAAAAEDATVVTTTGNHGDPSNFDSGRIIQFFESAA